MQVYSELLPEKVGWPVVPVLVTPDDQWIQDSEDIIHHLEAKFPDKKSSKCIYNLETILHLEIDKKWTLRSSIQPHGPKQKLAAALLQLYGDQHLQLAIMHYRWSFPENHDPWIYFNFGNTGLGILLVKNPFRAQNRKTSKDNSAVSRIFPFFFNWSKVKQTLMVIMNRR